MSGSTSFRALGTTAVIVVAEPEALPVGEALLRSYLDRVDATCSRFRDDSELARVNRRAGTVVQLSGELHRFVRAALDAARTTNGLVDPTLGADLRAAGYDRSFVHVEPRGRWRFESRSRASAGWRRAELDDERRQLRVPRGVELDLGSTAKALAADVAASSIAGATGAGTLVALGGDIAVFGEAPAEGWCVLVAERHDVGLDGVGERVVLRSGGLASSSTRVRRWMTDRGEMHHLLDPQTGLPVRSVWHTVSVAAESCLDANIASTAAIVLGDGAPAWLEQRGVHARLVARDGTVATTGGWPVAEERAA